MVISLVIFTWFHFVLEIVRSMCLINKFLLQSPESKGTNTNLSYAYTVEWSLNTIFNRKLVLSQKQSNPLGFAANHFGQYKFILFWFLVQATRLIKPMSMENHILTNDVLKDMRLKGTDMWTKTSRQVQSDFDHYLVQLQSHLNQKSWWSHWEATSQSDYLKGHGHCARILPDIDGQSLRLN